MKKEIERFEGKDGFERFLGFLAEVSRSFSPLDTRLSAVVSGMS
jgi:hypothetical protein